ncbi:hypothetical protein CDCA_CDCA04G1331 [Cyanidium caldarium]|uniref:tRNA-splicing endonuclease subunit Sen54 N-terminal domain-containing protein n=1 Tax=Cyanidium caldarium TaxID=2771 RepID=A0AAV9IT87_CYACA|nr:hypothetical protein CDCA_CDCA04G1331 [Cyanidium caldarium]
MPTDRVRGGRAHKDARSNTETVPWWQFHRGLPHRGVKDEALAPKVTDDLSTGQRRRWHRRLHEWFTFVAAPNTVSTRHLSVLEWVSHLHQARVVKPRGKLFQSLGTVHGPEQHLFPEEAVFLVDKGAADFYIDGVPASMERCMTLLLSEGVSAEMYYAFGHLRRLGYHVRRSSRAERTAGGADSSEGDALRVSFTYDVWLPGNFKRTAPGLPYFRAVVVPFDAPVPTVDALCALREAALPSQAKIITVDRSVVTVFDVSRAGPLSKPDDPSKYWLAERALVLQAGAAVQANAEIDVAEEREGEEAMGSESETSVSVSEEGSASSAGSASDSEKESEER